MSELPWPPYSTSCLDLQELAGLRVTVDHVFHEPRLDAPAERPFPFVYCLTIRNDSAESIQIKGRKWVVTDLRDGDRQVIEGDGVVGQFPRLAPGGQFTYQSYHPIAADSRAEGALLGRTTGGRPVLVRIPAFVMQVPRSKA